MTDSPSISWEKGARDPRHLLVLLGNGWPGPQQGHGGLNADTLTTSLGWRGFAPHLALTAEDARSALATWPIGAAILDLQLPPQDLYAVYELVHTPEFAIPCLLLGPAEFHEASRHRAAVDRMDEFVRVDETCTTEVILLYLRATLVRTYPQIGRPAEEPTSRRARREQVETAGLERENELICVFSAKGGTGKTTVACNIAVALALERQRSVALIDGDLHFGDVDVMLKLSASSDGRRRSLHTVMEALSMPGVTGDERSEQALASFDERLLEDVLYQHPSGARILLAPPRPELAERIPLEVVIRAVGMCRRQYEYTIIDMQSSYSEAGIQLLDMSSRIIVLLKPEMSCIRNTTLLLDYAVQFGWKDKMLLVLNRADSNRFTQISQQAVERHLGYPVLPVFSSGIVPQAASEGRTLIEAYSDSKVTAALRALVDVIDGTSGQEKPTSGGLKRLLTRPAKLSKAAGMAAG